MAAFWALFNNVFELRTDAFKISKISQRIFAQPSQGIGAWQVMGTRLCGNTLKLMCYKLYDFKTCSFWVAFFL